MATWVIDLDGVVWLTGEPLPGAADGVARLRHAGGRALFVTNNSSPTEAELQRRLRHCGIEAPTEDVITSAHAAARLLAPGARALVLGDDGLREALRARDVVLADEDPLDAVVVGWTHAFDFDALAGAASAVRRGARLIGTNEDATHPTPTGLLPGSGALLAAVAVAAGVDPEVAGKPHAPIVAAIAERADDVVVVVGDRPSTDGVLAQRLGVPFARVRSGVAADGDDAGVPAVLVADGLAPLVDEILASELDRLL